MNDNMVVSPDRLAQAKKDAQTLKEQIQALKDEKNDVTRTFALLISARPALARTNLGQSKRSPRTSALSRAWL